MTLPARIENEAELDALLSEPTPAAVQAMARLRGDVLLLGVAGKMGPTLARMVKRASELGGIPRRVIGVSRFSSGNLEAQLQAHGIETIRCDLLDETAVRALPDAPNILFMAGMKFGSTGREATTWAMNTHLPAIVCQKFHRSKIVAFSTGNVYGLTPVEKGGSVETDTPNPVGEYAMSCLGRERMFEYFSRTLNIPVALIRLNYAGELRYGALVDLAQQIFNGQTIDLSMGHLNTLWQADANAMTLCAFDHVQTPPFLLNVTGPELLRVRDVCAELARLLGKPVTFQGTEAPNALLNNPAKGLKLCGAPRVSARQMLPQIADWLQRGGPTLGKPTHFESRDGKF